MTRPLFPSPRPRSFALLGILLLGILATATWSQPSAAASRPAVRGDNAMVVSVDADATRVGVEVLRAGGNAVDASIAVAFALAVTYPEAGNLGGGGFLLLRTADGAYRALDFRETAPRRLRPDLFLDEDGRPVPGLSVRGGLAIGVPGTVAGLFEAHRRWGSLPWPELVAPAIRLAGEGRPVSRQLAGSLVTHLERLNADPGARAVFTRDGEALHEGDRLIQRDLARTLKRIAEDGPTGFYRGPTAEAIARTARREGGVMDEEDLALYSPVLREPLQGTYRGYRIISFPPPSSGGVVLLQILGILERFDLKTSGFGSSRTIHRMAEAERRAYADRSKWLGDPDFFRVPVGELLDRSYLASRAASIRNRKATPSRRIHAGSPPRPEPVQTTHFSVADSQGNAVALTTTLNSSYGAAVVAEGTGVLLNNEIDDFALAPGVPNLYGLVGGEANAVAGGKRPLSSMTPTIVEAPESGPRPFLILGSPGGATIITAVLQVLVNVIDHDMPLQEAVDAPRFHHQWLPDKIHHEIRTFSTDVARALEARGHQFQERERLGNVSAIGLDQNGSWLGAADPRREGHAAGF